MSQPRVIGSLSPGSSSVLDFLLARGTWSGMRVRVEAVHSVGVGEPTGPPVNGQTGDGVPWHPVPPNERGE
jgi:hypothetical protein